MYIEPNACILRPKPRRAPRLRLFCFPYAGGAASMFHRWPDHLPEDIEVCSVQYPGRGTRVSEPPCLSIGQLIGQITPSITALIDRPFALFGHSMGANVAFELAGHLSRTACQVPTRLFLSGRRAPHIPARRPPIHHLSEPEFWREVRELGGLPAELDSQQELLQLVYPAVRADFELAETCSQAHQPPLDIPLTLFGGSADPEAGPAEVGAWARYSNRDAATWIFSGNHFFLNKEIAPMMQVVAKMLANN